MAWYKAGGGSKPKQTKIVAPSTGVQEITADSGKELEKVTVQAIPSGALKTPTVNASGLVTSGVQTSGYLGTSAESTLQLSTQGARTFTPTITNTTLVSSGKYTTGAIICKGDANLKSENIKSGKSIFGVNGSAPVTKIDGVEVTSSMNLKTEFLPASSGTPIPKSMYAGNATVYNDAIYIIAPYSGKNTVYKLSADESAWTTVTTGLKYNSYGHASVVYNGLLHIIGGNGASGSAKPHYTWNGSTLTQLADAPQLFYGGTRPCVYNGKIHIWQDGKHYSYDGTTWTLVDNFISGYQYYGRITATTFQNKIYFCSVGNNLNTVFFSWDEANGYTKLAGVNVKSTDLFVHDNQLYFIYATSNPMVYNVNSDSFTYDNTVNMLVDSKFPTPEYCAFVSFRNSIRCLGLDSNYSTIHVIHKKKVYSI